MAIGKPVQYSAVAPHALAENPEKSKAKQLGSQAIPIGSSLVCAQQEPPDKKQKRAVSRPGIPKATRLSAFHVPNRPSQPLRGADKDGHFVFELGDNISSRCVDSSHTPVSQPHRHSLLVFSGRTATPRHRLFTTADLERSCSC